MTTTNTAEPTAETLEQLVAIVHVPAYAELVEKYRAAGEDYADAYRFADHELAQLQARARAVEDEPATVGFDR